MEDIVAVDDVIMVVEHCNAEQRTGNDAHVPMDNVPLLVGAEELSTDNARKFTKRNVREDVPITHPTSENGVLVIQTAREDSGVDKKKKASRKRCPHDKIKTQCVDCGGISICIHKKQRAICRECAPMNFCMHNKRQARCIDCGGSQRCEHDKIRSECKNCKGGSICDHNKKRSSCRECRPKNFCVHGKRPARCIHCGGSELCKHYKLRSDCFVCFTGKSNCEHKRRRSRCRDCGGHTFCSHGKSRSDCKECKGSRICACLIEKKFCAKHGGSGLCVVCRVFRANRKCDKHCLDCFVNHYPDDPRSANGSKLKRKETVVREAIDAVFKGFTHDKSLYTSGCCAHKRRIDHRILLNGTLLAIETDEKAHVSYNKEDEIIRYDDLFMVFGTKFVFIRFNCDTNREGRNGKTSFEHKLDVLIKCISTHIARIKENQNIELCHISKLFMCALCTKQGSDLCQCMPTPSAIP